MQLSKKIHNLEERLRRSLLREQALEDRVVVLAADIKTK